MDVAYACRQRDGGTLVTKRHLTHVAVDFESGESTRIPDEFREAVVEYQETAPDPV